jgi:hypothetical protein
MKKTGQDSAAQIGNLAVAQELLNTYSSDQSPVSIFGYYGRLAPASSKLVLEYYNPNREADQLRLIVTMEGTNDQWDLRIPLQRATKAVEIFGATVLEIELTGLNEFREKFAVNKPQRAEAPIRLPDLPSVRIAGAVVDRRNGISNYTPIGMYDASP